MQLPSYRWRFVHLAALWAYGVGQPVFSMLEGNPEFLVVRGSTRTDILVFALLVAVVPPLVVIAIEVMTTAISRMFADALHVVVVWCFAFLAALQLVRLIERPEASAALLIPTAIAAIVGFLYVKFDGFRAFLAISVALPVVGLLAFVMRVPLAIDDHPGAKVKVATSAPVVLVVLDEFAISSLLKPDGSIDGVRYPNFARLARQATWYPHATTVADYTTDAVPAILTGRNPKPEELPTLSDHPENLFTLLGETFAIEAREQVSRLCPSRYCPRVGPTLSLGTRQKGLLYDVLVGYLHGALPRSMTGGLPPLGERWGGFGDSSSTPVRDQVIGALDFDAWLRVAERAQDNKRFEFARFLQSIRHRKGRPTLHFLHLMLPHSPWQFLPSGREYNGVVTEEGMYEDWRGWRPSRWLVDQALQADLLQVGFTDRLIGALLNRLETTGLYDRALVVVTADHGMSFRSGAPPRVVTTTNVADIAGIPLFVKYPGQRAGRVDRREAQTIDVLPTIADVLGVRIPWHVDGRSLRRGSVPRKITVMRHKGGSVVADPSAIHRGVVATARRNHRLFGSGNESLYRLGPHRELLGQPLASLSVSNLGRSTVRFDDEALYSDVETSSLFVPARVMGSIAGAEPAQGTPLAITVNGTVSALTRSFDLGGQSRFAVLAPEEAFVDGRNLVEVFAIDARNGNLRLERLGGTGSRQAAASPATAAVRGASEKHRAGTGSRTAHALPVDHRSLTGAPTR